MGRRCLGILRGLYPLYDDIQGKRVLVVGASTGIGYSLAIALSNLGAALVLASRTTGSIVNAIDEGRISNAIVISCDITNSDDVQKLVTEIEPVDAVCFVAGAVKLAPKHQLKKAFINSQLDVNLVAPIEFLSSLFRYKKLNDEASIIFTTATARFNSVHATTPYAAAKNGLVSVVQTLAGEALLDNMRVNAVSFDYVSTRMTKDIVGSSEEKREALTKEVVGVSPSLNAVVPYIYLVSKASRWMTGQVIEADAGRRLSRVVHG
jgi:NAD(P)-dependent dehydrogenase (short-subunit alcohol dehydrogenase family)